MGTDLFGGAPKKSGRGARAPLTIRQHGRAGYSFAAMKYDLIVIGGGPAGYVGAIRAAQLGKRVACVEKERAGGTCLNWGCIPTKSLLRNAELYHLMKHRAGDFGIKIEGLSYDWSKVIKRSRDVSDKNAAGIEFLFKKNKIDYIRGEASMDKPGEVDGQARPTEKPKRTPRRRSWSRPASCRGRFRGCPSTANK